MVGVVRGGEARDMRQAGGNWRAVLLLCPTAWRADLEGNGGKLTEGGESSNKGQLYIRKAIWCGLSDEGQFQRRYHRSEFSCVSMPSRRKVRMNPFLNDWAADQAPANHSHRAWRSGVIMRICDAGKHASAGSSLWPCLPALGRIKSFYKKHFHNVPFNFFFYKSRTGTGRYLEDRCINVVITASNKMHAVICDQRAFLRRCQIQYLY